MQSIFTYLEPSITVTPVKFLRKSFIIFPYTFFLQKVYVYVGKNSMHFPWKILINNQSIIFSCQCLFGLYHCSLVKIQISFQTFRYIIHWIFQNYLEYMETFIYSLYLKSQVWKEVWKLLFLLDVFGLFFFFFIYELTAQPYVWEQTHLCICNAF